MKSLANTLTLSKASGGDFAHNYEFEDEEAATTQEAAIREILRYQRMDQWQPTYQNIVSEVSLEVRLEPEEKTDITKINGRSGET